MPLTGIICEYNPLHLGHRKQIDFLRHQGQDVVCVMSGNFVQRGHPAIIDKMCRAKAAVDCGADLVLELPITAALSSAEGFAAGGVAILTRLCDNLCFGAETADKDSLMNTAKALLSPAFSPALRQQLDKGLSFPAARQAALSEMGLDARLLETPNNILAVEYCKAILAQKANMDILPILRQGDYHDTAADFENPSATAVRQLMVADQDFMTFIPKNAQPAVANAPLHTLQAGEKAILCRLRTMTDAEFESLPYGSEGLWRKLMHASREHNSLEEIIAATKSKRYTRTRIDRMILCAFLGITVADLVSPIPYCRVLAFNDRGRAILKQSNEDGFFVNIGTDTKHPYQSLERRVSALYGLFSATPEPPDAEEHYRIYYKQGE
jgi:predicted nucleotidyltransferase